MAESLPVENRPNLGRDERCPLCGGDNACRVAKGHLYKGPCWCQRVVVPGPLLARLADGSAESACLCRPCLEAVARMAHEAGDADALLAKIRREIAPRAENLHPNPTVL